MYHIGDLYLSEEISGVIVSIDSSGVHGLIMSLYEANLNWYDSEKWCNNLGAGWFMPSIDDFKEMRELENLKSIQASLIQHGMPLGFGDDSRENWHGHMYWTRDFEDHYDFNNHDSMYVFCLCSKGFSMISSDFKDQDYSYIRAMHRF